jgi:hypothetical protein
VKGPHGEGVATHIGPEPCAAVRKGGGEARPIIPGADTVPNVEGHTIARSHVLDHAPTQRTDSGSVAHGESILSEVDDTSILRTRLELVYESVRLIVCVVDQVDGAVRAASLGIL